MTTIQAKKVKLGTVLADGSSVYDITKSALQPGALIIAYVLNGRCMAETVQPTDPIEIR